MNDYTGNTTEQDIVVYRDESGSWHLEGVFPQMTFLSDNYVEQLVQRTDLDIWIDEGRLFLKLANAEAVYRDNGRMAGDYAEVRVWQLERLEI